MHRPLVALLLCALACEASARDLSGTWTVREGGPRARVSGTVVFEPEGSPGEYRVRARYTIDQRSVSWTGAARNLRTLVRVRLSAARGAAGRVDGVTLEGTARYRLVGDALVGGWSLGSRTVREVLVREDSSEECGTLRPVDPEESAVGAFGAGDAAWPQLNANHPEVLTSVADGRGIVVSSLPPGGKADPGAHLDVAFDRPFRVFASNQNRTGRRIWQVVALANLGSDPVEVDVQALSSASTREAPYVDLGRWVPAEVVEHGISRFSGPGERAARDALLGVSRESRKHRLGPGEVRALSIRPLEHREERMTHAHLRPSGPLHAAVLYLTGLRPDDEAVERALTRGRLVARSEHDSIPSPPGRTSGRLIFGRVSGVVEASHWTGLLTNDSERRCYLTIPGDERPFAWNAKHGALGAAQAGRMQARLPDSAYRSWGNYGGSFELRLPLKNPTSEPQRVRVFVDSPGSGRARALRQAFELRIEGPGDTERRYARVSQRMGTRGETPLFSLVVPAKNARWATLRAVYSANNTAPNPVRIVVQPVGGALR